MLSRLTVCVSLASIFLGTESINIKWPSQLPFLQHGVHQNDLEKGDGMFRAMGPAPPRLGKQIPQEERDTWIVDCTSKLTKHECIKVVDGRNDTFWESIDVLPYNITIDLREVKNVNALSMRLLPDADLGGAVAGHKVYISRDKKAWKLVAFGTWFGDVEDKFAGFEPQLAQYLRLEATSATNGTEYIRIVDISEWGLTVNFPLVPVGVFIDPIGGKVISFSLYAHDRFGQGLTDYITLTATWDPTTYAISQRHIRETNHDMFCPGMVFDVNGRMVILGGETADKVSIYDPTKDEWTSVAPMKTARGYQGSITCATGKIFIVGGSWGPVGLDFGDRNGEIYDPEKDT
ncbi:MAG: hypothetical protein Q9225_007395 [Loekoesia sp. 1 TL-2023]